MHLHRLFASVLAVGGLAVLPAAAAPPASASAAQVTTPLPRTVRPTHYDVAVTPDAGALTFTGKVVKPPYENVGPESAIVRRTLTAPETLHARSADDLRLVEFINRCMAGDRRQRPASAASARLEIDQRL